MILQDPNAPQPLQEVSQSILQFKLNARLLKEIPIEINWVQELQGQLFFHLQYALNDHGVHSDMIQSMNHLAFEIWFAESRAKG